ncbi:hypothetical protein [Methylobacterium sp. SyP6R]|uniref:hypothetical protein n=1 Tax=Methylobacterium sp. SyP6R TaxID=2718876 RepID=UPI001F39A0E9|nr:hypothetical protein [Methylobacterium sp. SyP6R]MCF4126981.1 hypothetical protein [Methylobacterium sp. SyP6R]
MPVPEDGMDRFHAAAAQAALMLVESLMLVLVERGVIPADEVIEAVETVIETKRRLVEDGHEPQTASYAAAMLATIANSLAAAGPATKG